MKRKTGSKTAPTRRKRRGKSAANTSRRYELAGLGIIAVGLITLCGLFGLNVGFIGLFAARVFHYFFGVGALPVTILILLIGYLYISKHHGLHYSVRFFGILFLFLSVLAIWHHISIPVGEEILPESLGKGGGLLAGGYLMILRKFFGIDGALIILCISTVGATLLSTTWSLATGINKTEETAKKGANVAGAALSTTVERLGDATGRVEAHMAEAVKKSFHNKFYNQEKDDTFPEEAKSPVQPRLFPSLDEEKNDDVSRTIDGLSVDEMADSMTAGRGQGDAGFTIEYGTSYDDETAPAKTKPSKNLMKKKPVAMPSYDEIAPIMPAAALLDGSEASSRPSEADVAPEKPYELPRIEDILQKHSKKKNSALEVEIADNAHVLQKTLEDFHVSARIINACHGPAVTRYELEPAPGVRVNKITNLADDIALSLAASSVRIEPIPGKSAIGIEVPNKELEGVGLRDVLENDAFKKAKSKLTVGLGIDIGGEAIFADLAKMPHLLVAGATGSGKSVCINTIITSILFKAKPDEVKFILVDPKMVELSGYNGIPHLMVPVVTEAKKAASVLNWSVQEMEKRYSKFANCNVRNMESYNRKFPDDKMSAIVIIIDELADLMMVAPHDVEDAICRLAQKARAAGIHMVLATQRPSVDVITGIIKANIPSRISFAVSSQIDSRTILDRSGAEKLLGKGDMLFSPVGASKPKRVQGAFVSDEEVETLLTFIQSQGQEMEANEEIIAFTEKAMQEEAETSAGTDSRRNQSDELLPDAVGLVMSTGQASTSSLQRRFRVGYTRAARIIDEMEALGIVGPSMGSKPREILMTSEQAEAALMAGSAES